MSEPATPLPWFVPDKDQAAVWQGDIYPAKVASAKAYHAADAIADAAYIVEACNAYPHLVAALRKLVDAAREKEWDKRCCGEDGMVHYCGSCGFIEYSGHEPNCTYAAAIAEAERLLGDSPTS